MRLVRFSLVILVGILVAASATVASHAHKAHAAPTRILLIDKKICLTFTFLRNPGAATECADLGNPANLLGIMTLFGDGDSVRGPEDLQALDAFDADQMHLKDGLIFVIAFVDDYAPVTFLSDQGVVGLETGAAAGTEGNIVTCDATHPATQPDADCNPAGVGGDGIVVAHLQPKPGAHLGPGTVSVISEGIEFPMPFTIVGEPNSVTFTSLETGIAAGLEETECDLATDVAGFVEALGTAEKTVLIARALDDEGTTVTGAFIDWSFDDPTSRLPAGADNPQYVGVPGHVPLPNTLEKKVIDPASGAVIATNLTPTLNLGSFGLGAPNILCGGPLKTGTAVVKATIKSAFGSTGVDPFGNDGANALISYTVTGKPATISLTADPATLACDGTATSTVSATVADASGALATDGTKVKFDLQLLGTANPILGKTAAGVATSTITPLFVLGTEGATVVVTAGTIVKSVLVGCVPGGAGSPDSSGNTGGSLGGGARPIGTISGPDTGTGTGSTGGGTRGSYLIAALLTAAGVGVLLAGRKISSARPR
jgi:hypothetical protein